MSADNGGQHRTAEAVSDQDQGSPGESTRRPPTQSDEQAGDRLEKQLASVLKDIVALISSQAELWQFLLKERTRLLFARLVIFVHLWAAVVVLWIAANYCAYYIAAGDGRGPIPGSFTVMALHAILIAILWIYYKGLRL